MISEKITYFKNLVSTVNPDNFNAIALDIFEFQYNYNPIYKKFIDYLNININNINTAEKIPCLPISFFKTQTNTILQNPTKYFSSSGTTGNETSKHYYSNDTFYKENTVKGFEQHFFHPKDAIVLGLLPSYLERSGSSLVTMVEHFIQLSQHPLSGFFLYEHEQLHKHIIEAQKENKPILIIGVSYALLDFAEKFSFPSENNIFLMETGGMKGQRKELTREELHHTLKQKLNISVVYSEYGMTELLSQGYMNASGRFYPTNTLKMYTRELNDPFSIQIFGKTGGVNIIDLANIESCCFIATDDLGISYEDGSFDILGRIDHSQLRGCNLLIS